MSHADFDRPSADPAASDTSLPVPPPAPPRSSPPPRRPVPSGTETNGDANSGVGSARGIRWRGQLDAIIGPAAKKLGHGDDQQGGETKPAHSDRVTREAPPWLFSLVFHLILLLALALISSPVGDSVGTLMLSIGQSEQESPVELAEFSIAEAEVEADGEMIVESDRESIDVFDSAQLSEVDSVMPIEVGAGMELALRSTDVRRPQRRDETGVVGNVWRNDRNSRRGQAGIGMAATQSNQKGQLENAGPLP